MTAMTITHAVLIFALIAALSITAAIKRRAIMRFGPNPVAPNPITMGRASFLALGVLAAVPAAAIVSVLIGTLTSNLAYGAGRLPVEFWQTFGLVFLAGGVPLGLFIAAREVIFVIGKDHS